MFFFSHWLPRKDEDLTTDLVKHQRLYNQPNGPSQVWPPPTLSRWWQITDVVPPSQRCPGEDSFVWIFTGKKWCTPSGWKGGCCLSGLGVTSLWPLVLPFRTKSCWQKAFPPKKKLHAKKSLDFFKTFFKGFYGKSGVLITIWNIHFSRASYDRFVFSTENTNVGTWKKARQKNQQQPFPRSWVFHLFLVWNTCARKKCGRLHVKRAFHSGLIAKVWYPVLYWSVIAWKQGEGPTWIKVHNGCSHM